MTRSERINKLYKPDEVVEILTVTRIIINDWRNTHKPQQELAETIVTKLFEKGYRIVKT